MQDCWSFPYCLSRTLGSSSSIISIGITLGNVHLNWLNWFRFLYSLGRSTRCSDRLQDFSVTIPRCCKDVYVNSFFTRTARLWNSLPTECFPLTYDLIGFKSRINRYLLIVVLFKQISCMLQSFCAFSSCNSMPCIGC